MQYNERGPECVQHPEPLTTHRPFKEVRQMAVAKDITGQKFGRLTVIRCAAKEYKGRIYLCLCECGNTKLIKQCNLGKSTKSCGCLRKEVAKRKRCILVGNKHGVTHGMRPGGRKSPVYNSWQSMLKRCYSPKHDAYKNYGARGVTVCDRWRSFANFYADMGDRPPGKTLDRFPNNRGNYEPGNCRWASLGEQSNNKTNSYLISAFGKTQTMQQWAREVGLHPGVLRRRLKFLGWPIDKALTTPNLGWHRRALKTV